MTIFSAVDEVNWRAVEVSGEEDSWLRHGRQQYGRPHITVSGLHSVRHLCVSHSFFCENKTDLFVHYFAGKMLCTSTKTHIGWSYEQDPSFVPFSINSTFWSC